MAGLIPFSGRSQLRWIGVAFDGYSHGHTRYPLHPHPLNDCILLHFGKMVKRVHRCTRARVKNAASAGRNANTMKNPKHIKNER